MRLRVLVLVAQALLTKVPVAEVLLAAYEVAFCHLLLASILFEKLSLQHECLFPASQTRLFEAICGRLLSCRHRFNSAQQTR